MRPKFEISVLAVNTVQQLPGTWSEDDCLRMLKQLEFDGAENLAPARAPRLLEDGAAGSRGR